MLESECEATQGDEESACREQSQIDHNDPKQRVAFLLEDLSKVQSNYQAAEPQAGAETWTNEARRLFHELDSNGDGTLDQTELSSMLSDGGMSDGDIEQIFIVLDSDCDGQVRADATSKVLIYRCVQISEEEFVAGYQFLGAAREEAAAIQTNVTGHMEPCRLQRGQTLCRMSRETDALTKEEQYIEDGVSGRKCRLVLTCTEDASKHVDFGDLVFIEDGCAIADTAMRAISLDQLERIIVHIRRRLADDQEVWMVWNAQEQKKNKELMSPEAVTLYDLNDYCIKAATLAKQTSMVELMAHGRQVPDFFVSQYVCSANCQSCVSE